MLVSDEPGLGCAELLWVDEDEAAGLSEGLQHERRQPGETVTVTAVATNDDEQARILAQEVMRTIVGDEGNVDKVEEIGEGRGGGRRRRHGLQLRHREPAGTSSVFPHACSRISQKRF